MEILDYINSIFCNPNNNEFTQLILALLLGIIFSPWSLGFLYFFIFLVIYEIICMILTSCQRPYWNLYFRISIISASLLGWIIGRTIFGYDDPFYHKKKKYPRRRQTSFTRKISAPQTKII